MVKRLGKHSENPLEQTASASGADLDEVFGALGAGIRRGILERLRGGALPVMALAEAFPVSWPAVSKHLKVLEAAGLVERRVEGRVHRIALAPGALERAAGWLGAFEPAADADAPVAPAGALPLAQARAHAFALASLLAPALPVLRAALSPGDAPLLDGPPAYAARLLARRLAAAPELATELLKAVEALDDLQQRLATPVPLELETLRDATVGPSRLAFLIRHHPLLADLALVAPPTSVGVPPR